MGNYRCRKEGFLAAWQINAAELMFQGKSDDEIAREIYHIEESDPMYMRKIKTARTKLSKLRKNEKFQEYYRSIVTEWSVHNVGKALLKISHQLDDDNPWIVNKAANDILTQSKKFMGNDENSVSITFENPIALGSPDQADLPDASVSALPDASADADTDDL